MLIWILIFFIVTVLIYYPKYDSTSILPLLVVLMKEVPGDVLEMGLRPCVSFTLNHMHMYQRQITTVECNTSMIKIAQNKGFDRKYISPASFSSPLFNNVCYVCNPKKYDKYWNDALVLDHFYGIVIINHHPLRRRWKDIVRFRKNAYVLVIPNAYGIINQVLYGRNLYRAIQSFRYKFVTKISNDHIAVVSNFIDVGSILSHHIYDK